MSIYDSVIRRVRDKIKRQETELETSKTELAGFEQLRTMEGQRSLDLPVPEAPKKPK